MEEGKGSEERIGLRRRKEGERMSRAAPEGSKEGSKEKGWRLSMKTKQD